MPGNDDDTGGEAAASPGLNEMILALTGAFKNLSASRASPSVKLSKFRGTPQKSDDLSIREWLDEFDDYCSYYKLDKREKAQVMVSHLVGAAKDEVMCRESGEREDDVKLRKVLQARFGRLESVQSMTSALHSRVQEEGESLADFSSALIRMYDRMESIASRDEKQALKLLKNNTLKERFIKGVKEKGVQRELRRISISGGDESFLGMREAVLEHFQDADPTTARVKVRECEVEAARISLPREEPSTMKDMQGDIAHLKEALHEVVQTLQFMRQGPPAGRLMKCYNCGRTGHVKRDCPNPVKCYGCNGFGHMKKDCPKENGMLSYDAAVDSGTGAGVDASKPRGPNVVIRTIHGNDPFSVLDMVAESPTAVVKIAGESVSCILDTGAEASLMPQQYYEAHLMGRLGSLEETVEGIRVSGVSGVDIPIAGFFKATVEACGHSADVGFLVVREGIATKRQQNHPVILGCNALRALLQGEGSVRDQGDWDLVAKALRVPASPQVDGLQSTLKSKFPVVVPPLTIRRVVCAVGEPKALNGKEVFIESRPVGLNSVHSSLDIFEGCCLVEGSKVEIAVANRGENEVILSKDETLGSVVEVRRREEVCIQEQNGSRSAPDWN